MAFLKVEHCFMIKKYDAGGDPVYCPPKTFEGMEDIPKSRWLLTGDYVESNNNWRLNIDLENFEEFKGVDVIAEGTVHLTWSKQEYSCSSHYDYNAEHKQTSCYHFNVKTQLSDLKEKTVWSIERYFNFGNKKYAVDLNIYLLSSKPNILKMQSDFNDLFKNGPYSDLILVAEKEEFTVHKGILSVRSAVFRAMFEADMKEKQENKVVIEDVKSGILESMLKYMYTGTFEDSEEPCFLEDLYTAAEKYAVIDLKKDVAKKLCLGITVENIGRRLILAQQFKEFVLGEKCLLFIRDNCVDLAKQKESWLFS